MKRKPILALIAVCILFFASCGKQETTATTESIPATVESVQAETTAPEETEEFRKNAMEITSGTCQFLSRIQELEKVPIK